MNGRNHNLHHFFCALGIAFSTLAVGVTVGCDAMDDTEARVYSGGSVELTIGGISTITDGESCGCDEETTGEEPSTTGEEPSTTGEEPSTTTSTPETTGGEGEGCTLTQGYWKNHSIYAENKSQQKPWPISEDTQLCGQSWYDILHTPGKGDAFYVVAHQYIAASLNAATGADVPAEVADALTAVEGYLADCQISKSEKGDALASKDVLDEYNNGEIGPGHCDDGPETTGGDTGDDTTTGGETGGDEQCIVDCDDTTTGPIPQ